MIASAFIPVARTVPCNAAHAGPSMRATSRTRRKVPHDDQRARTTVPFAVDRTRAADAPQDTSIRTLRMPTSIRAPAGGKTDAPPSSTT
jgi:hypothetical protein